MKFSAVVFCGRWYYRLAAMRSQVPSSSMGRCHSKGCADEDAEISPLIFACPSTGSG
ncbi:hypothetical protein ACF3N7_05710 [Cruoricaptor ignavus]|uniref:hypothetical protein n=1 Tax=Cruoricaptor ignavus TaxID=1118202 RepID=UPI00370D7061